MRDWAEKEAEKVIELWKPCQTPPVTKPRGNWQGEFAAYLEGRFRAAHAEGMREAYNGLKKWIEQTANAAREHGWDFDQIGYHKVTEEIDRRALEVSS